MLTDQDIERHYNHRVILWAYGSAYIGVLVHCDATHAWIWWEPDRFWARSEPGREEVFLREDVDLIEPYEELWRECTRCFARPGFKCTTKHGTVSPTFHAGRRPPFRWNTYDPLLVS